MAIIGHIVRGRNHDVMRNQRPNALHALWLLEIPIIYFGAQFLPKWLGNIIGILAALLLTIGFTILLLIVAWRNRHRPYSSQPR
ncbi:MAG: hypothetical protein M3Z19_18185 [Chloroflexota bacterium]|nr:hypothetical protein [Chloroflexota bacterium]